MSRYRIALQTLLHAVCTIYYVLGGLRFQIDPPYSRAGCTSPFQPLLSRNHMAPQGPNCSVGFGTNNHSLHILVQIICDIYEFNRVYEA